jgi:hypothetical protein
MLMQRLLFISFTCAMSSAAIGRDQPPPWATAGDESGRTADTSTTAASQSPNATSRGAAVRSTQRAQAASAEPPQQTPPTATTQGSRTTRSSSASHSTAAGATVKSDQAAEMTTPSSQERARASSAKKSSNTARASRSAAAGGTAPSEQVADTSDTPAPSATARSSASDDATVYTSDAYIRSRGRDWGWLGLLGLLGLLRLVRRRRYERHTDTVVSRPVDDPTRGVRVYETPDPVARP